MFRKKSIKKYIVALMTIALYVSILPNFTLQAAGSILNVSPSSNSIQREGTVVLTVGISSDKSIKDGQFNFNFDSGAFDCLSCVSIKDGVIPTSSSPIVSGAAILFASSSIINNDANKVDILNITLKAKTNADLKSYSVSLVPGDFSDESGKGVQFTGANLTIAVAPSANTNVKTVFVGSVDVTSSLSRNIENGIAYAKISVEPEDVNAKVEFINPKPNAVGNFNFAVGDNNIQFVITAQDGSTKTYNIKVNRAAAGQPLSTSTNSPINSTGPSTIILPYETSGSTASRSPSPSGSASKLDSSKPSDNIGKKTEGGISALAAFFWIIVSLVIGIWIGMFIGYMWWGKKRSTRLFRY